LKHNIVITVTSVKNPTTVDVSLVLSAGIVLIFGRGWRRQFHGGYLKGDVIEEGAAFKLRDPEEQWSADDCDALIALPLVRRWGFESNVNANAFMVM
jgi:hypothetical protein